MTSLSGATPSPDPSPAPAPAQGVVLEVEGFEPKPGLKSSELWLIVSTGAAIVEVATQDGGPSWQAATCCFALALMAGAYTISRGLAKASR